MRSSSSSLIRAAIAAVSRSRTAARRFSIKGSTSRAILLMACPFARRFARTPPGSGIRRGTGALLFEIGVARQAFLVAAQQLARLLERHALGAQGRLGRPAHPRHQVAAVVT